MGLSLGDYYERLDENGVLTDDGFGFFDIGGLVTFPLSKVASSYGAWNFHAGLDFLMLGDTNQALNEDESTKVVFLFGIGLAY